MNASRLMALFHVSFMLVSIIALFLMATEVIIFDWLALWILVLAVALNAFFAVMWHDETKRKGVGKYETVAERERFFPMVSLVVLAHNQEPEISSCVKNLFNSAVNYRGPSEITVIDDGSTDNTYELAWSTLSSLQKETPQIHARVLKHMAHLGKQEAARTGANKATGEYVFIVDAATPCHDISINSLIDTIFSTREIMVTYEVRSPIREGKNAGPSKIWLCRADTLRRVLNEKQAVKAAEELRF